jgi:cytoskeletal protein RodZ
MVRDPHQKRSDDTMQGSRKRWTIAGGVAVAVIGGGFVVWLVFLGPSQATRSMALSQKPLQKTSVQTVSPWSNTSSPAVSVTTPTTHTGRSPSITHSTAPTHSSSVLSSSSSAPAQQYPGLAQQVAQEPMASLSQVQAAIHAGNPQRLGELHWNAADGQAVLQALGSTTAPASVTAIYAKTFLYAMLSNNYPIFLNAPGSAGAIELQTLGIPVNVSQVDQITLNDVQHGSSSIEYDYTVTYTTTQGAIKTSICSVTFNTINTKQWVLGGVADLG